MSIPVAKCEISNVGDADISENLWIFWGGSDFCAWNVWFKLGLSNIVIVWIWIERRSVIFGCSGFCDNISLLAPF